MSGVRFNHVFTLLMFLAGLCAFVVPVERTNVLRGRLDGLFAPVAYPVRRVAQVLTHRVAVTGNIGQVDLSAAPAEARAEILRLRAEVASLSVQVDRLRQLYANRDLAGKVRDYSVPMKVLGGDGRSSLTLQGSASDGVTPGMAVVCNDALVGRVTAAGAMGVQVQLVTHPRFRMGGSFRRFVRPAADAGAGSGGGPEQLVRLATPPPLVEGRGNGRMAVTNLTMDQVRAAGIAPGDLVLLDDNDDWALPAKGQAVLINGQPLGVVEQVGELARAPLFAEVIVKPQVNLLQLDEVMVVTGKLSEVARQQQQRHEQQQHQQQQQQEAARKAEEPRRQTPAPATPKREAPRAAPARRPGEAVGRRLEPRAAGSAVVAAAAHRAGGGR